MPRRIVSDQDLRSIGTVKEMPIGTLIERDNDSALYRYTLAGGTTLDPGKVATNKAFNSNVEDVTVAAAAVVGAKEVVIDAGGAITANDYIDGKLTINDGTGEGHSYRVKGNTATSGAAELTVKLIDSLEGSDLVADTSRATLSFNPWDRTIIVPATDQADFPAGVPNISITNAYYGFLQTHGECAVWADETFARGAPLTFGTGTAGQVEAVDAAGEVQFAVSIEAPTGADDYPLVFLQID